MKCPKCHSELFELRKEGVMIDVCKSCKGVWLDSGELENILMNQSYQNHHYSHDPYKAEKHKHKQEFKKKHPILYLIKEILD